MRCYGDFQAISRSYEIASNKNRCNTILKFCNGSISFYFSINFAIKQVFTDSNNTYAKAFAFVLNRNH